MADVGVDLLEGLGIPPQKHPELWAAVYTVDPRPVMVFPIQSLLSIFNECPDPALPGTVALHILKAIHNPVYGGFVLLPRLNAREETAQVWAAARRFKLTRRSNHPLLPTFTSNINVRTN